MGSVGSGGSVGSVFVAVVAADVLLCMAAVFVCFRVGDSILVDFSVEQCFI